jgi:hypothetical protein
MVVGDFDILSFSSARPYPINHVFKHSFFETFEIKSVCFLLVPFAFFLSYAFKGEKYFGEIVKINLIYYFSVVEDHFERSKYFLQILFIVCVNKLFYRLSF